MYKVGDNVKFLMRGIHMFIEDGVIVKIHKGLFTTKYYIQKRKSFIVELISHKDILEITKDNQERINIPKYEELY